MFSSLIELGIFLVCLGGMFYLFVKGIDLYILNRTRASAKEKELEKKE